LAISKPKMTWVAVTIYNGVDTVRIGIKLAAEAGTHQPRTEGCITLGQPCYTGARVTERTVRWCTEILGRNDVDRIVIPQLTRDTGLERK